MSFPRSRLPRWLTTLLVWGLLWSPLWGQWHGMAHSARQALSESVGLHQAQVSKEAEALAVSEHGGHAAGSELCQVLDHLAHAERLGAPSTAWSAPRVPAQTPVRLVAFSPGHDGWSPAQARAPPAPI